MSPAIEILNTGTELLLGRVLNTHQHWLCRQLADHGYLVPRQTAIPDAAAAIQEAVREALGRADWVICTGGLGPTSDDLTRDLIAQLLGRPLVEDAAVLDHLSRFYAERRRAMSARARLQAQVPAGAQVLLNDFGTAPGLVLDVDPNPFRPDHVRTRLVMLPGPPRELRPMFTRQVLPLIEQLTPLRVPFACRTLRSTGIPESQVEERVAGPLSEGVERGLEIGYCARPGEVDVRLTARVPGAESLVEAAAREVRERLGESLFGEGEETLEAVVVQALRSRGCTLAVAESCTGGHVANRLTDIPGVSAVLIAGWVTYRDAAKRVCLGVPEAVLAEHGAVSEPVARAMAEGARRVSGADYALALTGIAGPEGGSPDKPVGTVFIALASASRTFVVRQQNAWDRLTFKHVTSQQALELLRRELQEPRAQKDNPATGKAAGSANKP